ncbi:hypothetical protein TpMuguga_04g00237 [Theileria parva strain Muguga]|uniref:Uncharacterized protein n=1 Tax=Theileria parva TaxID=5875 RepID=Q4N2V5_THEPA|nr:uncharacterized protein TpMuguga_04g00237 [Theileria parva strain Muguga]EAN31589.1 hypothetical protein TpMuguga_04g00237 [Theileria parva strain Muguga]|eukprot:XP_763872.1 hypothetical protein [Theileria parva strain Muguga]
MSKGLRSKTLRRYRTAKRRVVEGVKCYPSVVESYKKIRLIQQGKYVPPVPKPNKFLYPEDENAVFPQAIPKMPLDLRSENVPLAGLAGPRGRRKFEPGELEESGIGLKMDKKTLMTSGPLMDLDDQNREVQSTARQGHFKSGKAKKYAANKLNTINKLKKSKKS